MQEFNDQFIALVGEQLESLAVDRATKIAIAAHNLISEWNPVDTGQSRAGWNFTLNQKDFKVPPKREKGGPVLQRQESKPDKDATKFGDTYHLVNAVGHTVYLNEGHSDKAPEYFIEKSCVKAVAQVDGR